MKAIIREAAAIVTANGLHRKGVRAQEVSREYTFNHLHGEIVELYEALRRNDPVDEQKNEMGDILGLLSHTFVREGWGFDEIEARGILKLRTLTTNVRVSNSPAAVATSSSMSRRDSALTVETHAAAASPKVTAML